MKLTLDVRLLLASLIALVHMIASAVMTAILVDLDSALPADAVGEVGETPSNWSAVIPLCLACGAWVLQVAGLLVRAVPERENGLKLKLVSSATLLLVFNVILIFPGISPYSPVLILISGLAALWAGFFALNGYRLRRRMHEAKDHAA